MAGCLTWPVVDGFGCGGPLSPADHAEAAPPLSADHRWMAQALVAAREGIGHSIPNPAVGAVIADAEGLISQGATEAYGGRHAERVAIDRAQGSARLGRATLYVTLEPCAHTGRQPPCVEAIIAAGIRRVVVGSHDPNPLVNGAGLRRLQAAGITLVTGVLGEAAALWHSPFLLHCGRSRPVVAAKWAQSLDGAFGYRGGVPQWLSGAEARAHTHWLRQKYDGILVGARTVLADRPRLTVRDCAWPINRHPVRIVLDPHARLFDLTAEKGPGLTEHVLGGPTFSPDVTTVVLGPEAVIRAVPAARREDWWAARRTALVALPAVSEGSTGEGSTGEAVMTALTSAAVTELLGRPLQSVMIEGGAQTIGLLAAAIDLCHVFIAPLLLGRAARGPTIDQVAGTGGRFTLLSRTNFGPDILAEYGSEQAASRLAACGGATTGHQIAGTAGVTLDSR